MEIGEFESEDIGELLVKSQRLEKQFEFFCRQHNKRFETSFLAATKTETYYLKIIINDKFNHGNPGEIKTH